MSQSAKYVLEDELKENSPKKTNLIVDCLEKIMKRRS